MLLELWFSLSARFCAWRGLFQTEQIPWNSKRRSSRKSSSGVGAGSKVWPNLRSGDRAELLIRRTERSQKEQNAKAIWGKLKLRDRKEKEVHKERNEKEKDSTADLIHLVQAIREHIGHFVWIACQLSTGQLIQHSQMVTQHFCCVYVCFCKCECVRLCLQQKGTDVSPVPLSISCCRFSGASPLSSVRQANMESRSRSRARVSLGGRRKQLNGGRWKLGVTPSHLVLLDIWAQLPV